MSHAVKELSKRNESFLDKNRYFELKHFCLQFWDWQKKRLILDGIATREKRDPTEEEAIERAKLSEKIQMVLTAVDAAGEGFNGRLLDGVTKEYSYDSMNAKKLMPVSRDAYYKAYRKVFWILDKLRD